MSPAILVVLVIGATLAGSAIGGPLVAIIFAVAASVVAAFLQIRAVGRPKD
jgi:hypothetical protein